MIADKPVGQKRRPLPEPSRLSLSITSMKTHQTIRSLTLAAFASILASFASAQVTGAVDSGTRATTAAQNSAIHSQQAANAAARSNPTAAANANRASSAGVNSGTNAAAGVQADRPRRDGVGVNEAANANASLAGQTNGLSVANSVSGGIAGSLNSAAMVSDIRNASQATRTTMLAQVDSSLDASARAVADLRRSGRELKGEARARFDAAYDDLRAQEKTVKRSLSTARKAKDSTWADAQSQLASDYEAYAQAVSRAEAAAQGSASASGSVNR